MAVYIALLRGVNVGGKNLIKMDALRELCGALNFGDARTHLQSGNIVFRASGKTVAEQIEKAIEREFGFHTDTILRTAAEMKEAIARSPFEGRGLEPNKVLVYFLGSKISAAGREKVVEMARGVPEEVHIHERELFVYFPNGMGRPKLSMAAVDRALKVTGTGRNWNTVTKLVEIAEEIS